MPDGVISPKNDSHNRRVQKLNICINLFTPTTTLFRHLKSEKMIQLLYNPVFNFGIKWIWHGINIHGSNLERSAQAVLESLENLS